MKFLDLTLPSPEENLALDEALLDACESGAGPEVLRIWTAPGYFVVTGYANRLSTEVDRDACARLKIPVLRRCSGGGTVLQGPGCLNYAVVLRIGDHESLVGIPSANRWIMKKQSVALARVLGREVQIHGHTDLVVDDRKCSGNAQRRRRTALLFHGSFLLDLDLTLVSQTLCMPTAQPKYRAGRSHLDFLVNLHLDHEALSQALRAEWGADELMPTVPLLAAQHLVASKYSQELWTNKF
jgi:lipoate-protein ligase A